MSSSKQSSFNNNILSKDLLYTPLINYINNAAVEQDHGGDGVKFNTTQKKGKLSKRESELYDLLVQVSQEKSALSRGGLKRSEIESKLRSRSLMLVGGGLANTFKSSKKQNNKKSPLSHSEQKRRKIFQHFDYKQVVDQDNFHRHLLKLNERWIHYVRVLLEKNLVNRNIGNNHYYEAFGRLLSFVEWTGAFVRVVFCGNKPSVLNQSGIILQSTKNTWVMLRAKVVIDNNSNNNNNSNDNDEDDTGIGKHQLLIIGKPINLVKHQTSLEVHLESLFVKQEEEEKLSPHDKQHLPRTFVVCGEHKKKKLGVR